MGSLEIIKTTNVREARERRRISAPLTHDAPFTALDESQAIFADALEKMDTDADLDAVFAAFENVSSFTREYEAPEQVAESIISKGMSMLAEAQESLNETGQAISELASSFDQATNALSDRANHALTAATNNFAAKAQSFASRAWNAIPSLPTFNPLKLAGPAALLAAGGLVFAPINKVHAAAPTAPEDTSVIMWIENNAATDEDGKSITGKTTQAAKDYIEEKADALENLSTVRIPDAESINLPLTMIESGQTFYGVIDTNISNAFPSHLEGEDSDTNFADMRMLASIEHASSITTPEGVIVGDVIHGARPGDYLKVVNGKVTIIPTLESSLDPYSFDLYNYAADSEHTIVDLNAGASGTNAANIPTPTRSLQAPVNTEAAQVAAFTVVDTIAKAAPDFETADCHEVERFRAALQAAMFRYAFKYDGPDNLPQTMKYVDRNFADADLPASHEAMDAPIPRITNAYNAANAAKDKCDAAELAQPWNENPIEWALAEAKADLKSLEGSVQTFITSGAEMSPGELNNERNDIKDSARALKYNLTSLLSPGQDRIIFGHNIDVLPQLLQPQRAAVTSIESDISTALFQLSDTYVSFTKPADVTDAPSVSMINPTLLASRGIALDALNAEAIADTCHRVYEMEAANKILDTATSAANSDAVREVQLVMRACLEDPMAAWFTPIDKSEIDEGHKYARLIADKIKDQLEDPKILEITAGRAVVTYDGPKRSPKDNHNRHEITIILPDGKSATLAIARKNLFRTESYVGREHIADRSRFKLSMDGEPIDQYTLVEYLKGAKQGEDLGLVALIQFAVNRLEERQVIQPEIMAATGVKTDGSTDSSQ
ncbi:hypothetical protein HOD30_03960 [Candidatus Peregrinibacteria bacterium]|jgi:hypothetical protein|nr:hypothetical protein [Candidatus Peregrinibacteria bacterium]MBT4632099.1 hypothetical protein [Candidatus Peregrinibacteria bacterium]MBT5516527.1 hypothetical protein [Candidatus Peregrinibacteria bacterium]MBT5823565.1 hypothetical protein [Candidatus Peregrinibacteria bacterium]